MLSKASHLNPHTKNLQMANSEQIETEIELVARIFSRLDKEEGDCNDRICPNCEKEYVSVVFLPCTHHVLGIGCGDSYGKKRRPCICLLRLSNSAEDCGICCTILVIVASYLDVTCLIRNTPKPSILIHLKQVGISDFYYVLILRINNNALVIEHLFEHLFISFEKYSMRSHHGLEQRT